METDVNVPTEINKQNKLEKNLFFVGILEVTNEKSRIRIRTRPGSVNQVYRSKDPDPDPVTDPYKNFPDPER